MADIDLKAATPDTSLPSTGFLFGADSQSAAAPSVYSVQTVATALLGSTSLTGATETTSKPILDAAQTWNAAGVTFTAVKMNVTDTASASGSLLMDLQVGGSSRFSVSKAGYLNLGSNGGIFLYADAANNISFGKSTDYIRLGNNKLYIVCNNAGVGQVRNTGFVVANSGAFSFTNGDYDSLADAFLTRRAAASLRLGAADAAAPVAQTLGVQSVVAGTTNTAGADWTFDGSQGTGTGAGGSLIFRVAPAGSSGSAQNALATALTIDSTKLATFAANVVIAGNSFSSSGSNLYLGDSANSACVGISGAPNAGVTLKSDGVFRWTNGTAFGGTADLFLYRDAANTLAQRNGANAQAFRVYNTFTDASNYERGVLAWVSNDLKIGVESAGTGVSTRQTHLYGGV